MGQKSNNLIMFNQQSKKINLIWDQNKFHLNNDRAFCLIKKTHKPKVYTQDTSELFLYTNKGVYA